MAQIKNITLPVTGMTCANCAATIERNVRKLPGVDVANVNLASEKLTVTFDPAQLDEHGIIARVERIGYGIPTGKVELPITGLRDNSDALTLEKLLARQEGVLAASVSYGTERATLQYHPRPDQHCRTGQRPSARPVSISCRRAKPSPSRMSKPRCAPRKSSARNAC